MINILFISSGSDFVWTFGLRDLPNNTTKTSGLCAKRPRRDGDGFEEDIAYRIDNKHIAISTPELFPRAFPKEYVIMATFRAELDNAGSLFSILTSDRQLSLAFSLNPVGLKYLKPDGNIGMTKDLLQVLLVLLK